MITICRGFRPARRRAAESALTSEVFQITAWNAQWPLSGSKKAMTRLLPTVVRMGSCGPTGPRFWDSSSARADGLTPVRATRAIAAAKLSMRVSGNIVRSPLNPAQAHLELERDSSESPTLVLWQLPQVSSFRPVHCQGLENPMGAGPTPGVDAAACQPHRQRSNKRV